jgi:hypothetical protein
MNYEDITKTVKKKVNVLVVNQLSLRSQAKIIHTEVFSNRIKLFNFFNGLGVCYKKKNGNNFSRPIVTYKSFAEYIRNGEANYIHVASTGVFSGTYLVQIITVK